MDWFLKFCDAINYIHSRQIVHRDLKPDNIFVFQDKKTNEIHLKIGMKNLQWHLLMRFV